MRTDPSQLAIRVGEVMTAAGIDNFQFHDNVLTMCGVDYRVEYCGCDEPDCNGLQLRRVRSGTCRSNRIDALQ